MTELTFSIYGDQPTVLEDPAFLLDEFKRQYNISVALERMPFEKAWPQLVNVALHGGGPHISQIGAIWISTLMQMNVLRQFNAAEIASMGGVEAFFPATWTNALLADTSCAWGMPLSAYIYYILYRRDLLQQAGVDEKTAFQSADSILETVRKCAASNKGATILLPSIKPFNARIHISASWVWEAQGDFMSADGQSVLLDEPQTLKGLSAFYQLYRALSPQDTNLSHEECILRFLAGDAAIAFGGIGAQALLDQADRHGVIENLGIAPLPGIPWIGGSNLVIWNETRMFPAQEKAALTLVRVLADAPAQKAYALGQKVIPARKDALAAMEFEPSALKQVCEQSLQIGRTYHAGLGWMRMLSELRYRSDAITKQILSNPEMEVERIVEEQLRPVAEKFKLLISQ